MENREAATARLLLAFQGAGHTPDVENGPFFREVFKGWNYLRKRQDDDGNFFHEGASNHMFYTHALCTIALCELYGMTGDEEYREPCAAGGELFGRHPSAGRRLAISTRQRQ